MKQQDRFEPRLIMGDLMYYILLLAVLPAAGGWAAMRWSNDPFWETTLRMSLLSAVLLAVFLVPLVRCRWHLRRGDAPVRAIQGSVMFSVPVNLVLVAGYLMFNAHL